MSEPMNEMTEQVDRSLLLPETANNEQPIVAIKLIGSDGHSVTIGLTERNAPVDGKDGKPFASGTVGYNASQRFEWAGKDFRLSCNVILSGSATDGRKRRAAANKAQQQKAQLRRNLTSIGLEVATIDRVIELVNDEEMSVQEAIAFASAEASDGHATRPNGHVTA